MTQGSDEREYRDALGRDIRVGDIITYATQVGHRAALKFGRVVALTVGKEEYGPKPSKIKVQSVVRNPWGWWKRPEAERGQLGGQNNGRPVTLERLDAVCIICRADDDSGEFGKLVEAIDASTEPNE